MAWWWTCLSDTPQDNLYSQQSAAPSCSSLLESWNLARQAQRHSAGPAPLTDLDVKARLLEPGNQESSGRCFRFRLRHCYDFKNRHQSRTENRAAAPPRRAEPRAESEPSRPVGHLGAREAVIQPLEHRQQPGLQLRRGQRPAQRLHPTDRRSGQAGGLEKQVAGKNRHAWVGLVSREPKIGVVPVVFPSKPTQKTPKKSTSNYDAPIWSQGSEHAMSKAASPSHQGPLERYPFVKPSKNVGKRSSQGQLHIQSLVQ